MTVTAEPSFVAETLAWCNARRAEKNLEPLDRLPKGVRGVGSSCPCGKATGLWVGSQTYDDGHKILGDLPRAVQRFVYAFDERHLPQYDEAVA